MNIAITGFIYFVIGFAASFIIASTIKYLNENRVIDFFYKNPWIVANENVITFVGVVIIMIVIMFVLG